MPPPHSLPTILLHLNDMSFEFLVDVGNKKYSNVLPYIYTYMVGRMFAMLKRPLIVADK